MGTVRTDGLDHYCWFPGASTYCVTGCNVAGINSTSADRPDLSAHTWIHEVVVGVDDVMDKLVSLPITIQNLGKKYAISTHSTSVLVVFISHFSQGPGYISFITPDIDPVALLLDHFSLYLTCSDNKSTCKTFSNFCFNVPNKQISWMTTSCSDCQTWNFLTEPVTPCPSDLGMSPYILFNF